INALLYLPGHSRQQLLRALRIPALSPGWQASFRALLEAEPGGGNACLTATTPPPAWPGFRDLTVTALEHESDSVVSIRLEAREVSRSLPTVHTPVCFSRPGPEDLEGREFDGAGRLSASLLAELELPRDAEAYLCGPAAFMDEISAGLAAIGLDAAHIHTEP